VCMCVTVISLLLSNVYSSILLYNVSCQWNLSKRQRPTLATLLYTFRVLLTCQIQWLEVFYCWCLRCILGVSGTYGICFPLLGILEQCEYVSISNYLVYHAVSLEPSISTLIMWNYIIIKENKLGHQIIKCNSTCFQSNVYPTSHLRSVLQQNVGSMHFILDKRKFYFVTDKISDICEFLTDSSALMTMTK